MNTSMIKILMALCIWALMPSCKKDVETEPQDLITSDLVWNKEDKNAFYAKQYLANLYNYLPNGFTRVNGDFLDAGAGDAVPSRNLTGTNVGFYTNGLVSTINNPDGYWNNSYQGIRNANIFFANIDSVPTSAANNAQWKAEVRFIRAFMYFELLKRYGGVPMVGNQVFDLNSKLELPRNTFDQVVNYIATECDSAKVNLTADAALLATDAGRIPKGAAVALKCRLFLYAASPLWNGGAPPSDQKTKGYLGYTTADPARWQKVIDAVTEFKALGFYGTLQANYINLFVNTNTDPEIILAKQAAKGFQLELDNGPVGYTNGTQQNGGRTSPTQGFVDAFSMNNGLPITDPASGYSAAAPYTNRDPRLTATVFFNGTPWFSRPVETFEGGRDKPNTPATVAVQTKTGYYLRKFLGNFNTSTAYGAVFHNFIYFRFAEILLNNAEALNEVGRVEDAVLEIKKIRTRAGIVAGANTRYGIAAGITQADMRTLIQNERRVELAFEEHRFWDIRRWKTANTAVSGPLTGMQITKTGATTFTYQIVTVGNMTFSDKLYFMPIPYDEVVKNANMVQNPGW